MKKMLAIMITTLCVINAVSAVNYIRNGGFEYGMNKWDNVYNDVDNDGAHVSVNGNCKHWGKQSMNVSFPRTRSGAIIRQTLKTMPEGVYTLSFWAYNQKELHEALVEVYTNNRRFDYTSIGEYNGWKKYTIKNINIFENDKVHIELSLHGYESEWICLDDFKLKLTEVAQDNFMNPGFEDGLAGWTINKKASYAPKISTKSVHSEGEQSLNLWMANAGWSQFETSMTVFKSGFYKTALWYRGKSTWNKAQITVFRNGDRIGGAKMQPNRRWSEAVTDLFQVSKGDRITLKVYVKAAAKSWFYFDDADIFNAKDESSSLPEGLIAYYPFDGNLKDESGFNNHASFDGANSFTADRFDVEGMAVPFYYNDTVTIDSFPGTGTKGWTYSFWYRGRFLANGIIFNKEGSASLSADAERGEQYVYVRAGYNRLNVWSPYIITHPNNMYNHVSISYQIGATDATLKFYVNGAVYGKDTRPSGDYNDLAGPLTLGGITIGNYGEEESIDGSIDDFRFYDRPLSESEIISIYLDSYGPE